MSKKLRVILSFVMLGVVLFTALPKVYIHKLMGHNHVIEQTNNNEENESYNSNHKAVNCELEKFETPVYFTIFKVILNCSPLRQHTTKVSCNYQEKNPTQGKVIDSLLRGPPRV
jgi:hypothetical protein